MWTIMVLLFLICIYLLKSLRRQPNSIPAAKIGQVSNPTTPIVHRSYTYGQGRPSTAYEAYSNQTLESDVTFADESLPEDESQSSLPAWEVLQSGPAFMLGRENEDGTPNEYLTPPPEIPAVRNKAEDLEGLVDYDPDEREPTLMDITDEEKQAIDGFDVRAFR